MARSSAWALLALVAVVQLACWRGTQRLEALGSQAEAHPLRRRELPQLLARWPGAPLDALDGLGNATLHARSLVEPLAKHEEQCFPLPILAPADELCAHVTAFCPPSGRLDYLRFYYCAGVRPAGNETAEAGKDALAGPLLAHGAETSSHRHADEPLPDGAERPPTHSRHGSTAPRHGKDGPPLPAGVALQRGLALATIVLWMLFLFSWVGVVASDFFCPNLSTLASRLGLNESTAGVTFLAFGNGSPDVFSTFGAMKTGSGSLAIGELIGAASFIVSVISGSMMLIAPFHVKAYPFLRDVGFFTVAVAMTLAFLFDGHLRFAECLSLVALYVCYATTVIIGSWVQERRRRRRMAIAAARGEYTNSRAGSPYQDEPSLGDVERASTQGGLLAVPGAAGNSPYLSPVSPSEYDPDVNPIDIWADQAGRPISSPPSPRLGAVSPATTPSGGRASLVRSQTRFRSGVVARHSLLGAVEFRDVVRSLQLESTADRSAEVFAARDPERFLPHPAHAHGRPRHTHKRGVSVGAGPMSALEPSASAQSFSAPGRNRSNSTGASSKPKLARSHSAVPDLGGDDATSGGWSSLTVRQAPRGREAVPAPVDDPWREHGPGDACDDELLLPPSTMPLGADATRTVPALSRLDTRLAPPASVGDSSSRNHSPVPSIHISAANPEDDDFKARRRASVSSLAKPSRTQRALELHREFTRPLRRALFPSLRHFKDKSWLGLFVSVVTAPALLLLNLTLPIVDDDAEARAIAMPEQLPGGAVRLEGEERLLTAHAEVSSEEEAEGPIVQLGPSTPDSDPWAARDRQHNAQRDLGVAAALRHLPSSDSLSVHTMTLDEPAAPGQQAEQCDDCASVDSHSAPATGAPLLQSVAQCAFSPPFVVWALTDPHESGSGWKVLVALLAGLVLGALVLAAGLRARARGGAWYSHKATLAAGMARCSLGFLVSVMWIMTIVDEVVSILQTIGLICGLSDAILGLTVFAMGNSLGDLVANVTIARMGHPVMAISACFAGPLLNLLLGIGISGTYLLSGSSTSHIPQVDGGVYHIDFSPTLLVSGLGLLLILLGTLVAVPMNGFLLSRGLGYTLIATYAAIMCTNILVEVFYMRQP